MRGQINPVTGITEGKMRTLIKAELRTIWRRTTRRQFLMSVRRRERNPKSGREWFVVDCVDCGRVMGVTEKERRPKIDGTLEPRARSVFEVDHVDGITPLTDIRTTLGEYWNGLIYGRLEAVCVACHKIRSAKQTKERNQQGE